MAVVDLGIMGCRIRFGRKTFRYDIKARLSVKSKDNMGRVPQEKEVNGLASGEFDGSGNFVAGFSYTSTPLSSVSIFFQPSPSTTAIKGL